MGLGRWRRAHPLTARGCRPHRPAWPVRARWPWPRLPRALRCRARRRMARARARQQAPWRHPHLCRLMGGARARWLRARQRLGLARARRLLAPAPGCRQRPPTRPAQAPQRRARLLRAQACRPRMRAARARARGQRAGRPRARGLASPPRLLPAPSRAPGRPARPWTARLLAGAPARLVRREQSAHVSWVPACRPAQPWAGACDRAQAAVVAQRTLGAGQQAGERDRSSPRPPSGAAWKHGAPAACAGLLLFILQKCTVPRPGPLPTFSATGASPLWTAYADTLGVSLVSWMQSVSLFQQTIRLGHSSVCLRWVGRMGPQRPCAGSAGHSCLIILN